MISLERDSVHVWRAALDQPQGRLDNLQRTLSDDEQRRAARFVFQRDQDRFTVARGALRAILSQYLDVPPEQLRFAYGRAGKPELAEGFDRQHLRFNLSHSHGQALYALTHRRLVGVDIERIRADVDVEQVAGVAFAPAEVAELLALPAALRPQAFFACWTRKEAYAKARGEGISLAWDQFQVSFAPGAPAALLRTEWDHREASRWSLYALAAGHEYAAALAAEGQEHIVRYLDWPKGG